MSESETETNTTLKLIRFVEQHQILHSDTRNSKHDDIKKFLWRKIATELKITDAMAKKKWRHLRDGFEIYKTILNGNVIQKCHVKYRNWYWGPHLQFLENSDPETVYVSDGEPGDIKLEPDNDEKAHNSCSSPQEPINVDHPDAPDVPRPFVGPIILESDVDYLFKSYAETFKRYNPITQAKLKMEISSLFFKHEMIVAQKRKIAMEMERREIAKIRRLGNNAIHQETDGIANKKKRRSKK